MSPRCLEALVIAALATLAPELHAEPAKPKHHDTKKKPKPSAGVRAVRAAPAIAAPPRHVEADAPLPPITLDLHRATLANGLRVVVNVDHAAPTVAIAVVYDVGSRDEPVGRSGFAHLFEHMMFQGSRNVARGDHFRLVAGHGGELNGTTNTDRTSYFEVLPENEVALGLWLEADRMRSLDVSQANFDNQRKVVEEELRMRVSNVAYGPSRIRREELVYQGYWPYGHATVGSMIDLDGAQLPWVQAFHASHYGPNRAVLSVAGDVDPERVMSLARRYFEEIPRAEAPSPARPGPDGGPDRPELPPQTAERRERIEDAYARSPGVFLGWAIPAARAPDHDALDLCADLLGGGESSRLYQLLVKDHPITQSVSASTQRRRGPDLFEVDAILATGAKLAEVEQLIDKEIQALASRGPTDAELAKAKRRVAAAHLLELQSNLARARRLGEYELFFGDPSLLAADVARYAAVTRDDVKRVASQYLTVARRTLVEVGRDGEASGKRGATSDAPVAKPHPAKAAPAKAKAAKKAAKSRKAKKS